MEKTKVLFVSQEISPYMPENKISTLCRSLPQGVQEAGKEIRTFMPRYGCINERRHQLHEVIRLSGMNLVIDDCDHPLIIKVASIQQARMQVYFIDNDDLFQRKFDVTDDKGDYFSDNDERSIFFIKGVFETVKKLRWVPDVIHCSGWFTALLPLYLKYIYSDEPTYTNSKVVYSIMDDAFPGKLSDSLCKKLINDGIPEHAIKDLENSSYLNLCKNAIDNSDGVILGDTAINFELQEYLKIVNKPILEFDCECMASSCSKYYDKIISEVLVTSE